MPTARATAITPGSPTSMVTQAMTIPRVMPTSVCTPERMPANTVVRMATIAPRGA